MRTISFQQISCVFLHYIIINKLTNNNIKIEQNSLIKDSKDSIINISFLKHCLQQVTVSSNYLPINQGLTYNIWKSKKRLSPSACCPHQQQKHCYSFLLLPFSRTTLYHTKLCSQRKSRTPCQVGSQHSAHIF